MPKTPHIGCGTLGAQRSRSCTAALYFLARGRRRGRASSRRPRSVSVSSSPLRRRPRVGATSSALPPLSSERCTSSACQLSKREQSEARKWNSWVTGTWEDRAKFSHEPAGRTIGKGGAGKAIDPAAEQISLERGAAYVKGGG